MRTIHNRKPAWKIGRFLTIAVCLLALTACELDLDGGVVTDQALPDSSVLAKGDAQLAPRDELDVLSSKQILFGDLHVHSAFSTDAFITSMPLMGGGGLHPPADACDFARYCSALDFWSINDHAEGVTPERWMATKDAIRQCNAVAGDTDNPDLVSFLGWEWSHVDTDPAKHYGHKNVYFLDTDEALVPNRPIAAPRDQLGKAPLGKAAQLMLAVKDFPNRDLYLGIGSYYQAIDDTPKCERGIDVRDLPSDCIEEAYSPAELFTKLDQWGFDSIVIPHGNAWGMNTPPTTSWDKQVAAKMDDPLRQFLVEIYSGHGNSEEYRSWRAVDVATDGTRTCPLPGEGFQPCCHRAGEIIRQRCDSESLGATECDARQTEAQQNYVDAGISGHLTVPGAQVADWLNCGQCTDCFNPTFKIRPGTTSQYALAKANFDQPEAPRHFRWGFIGSSDNHRSRPGTGYKEFDRLAMTESNGPRDKSLSRNTSDSREPEARSVAMGPDVKVNLNRKRNMERQGSFWMTGGLVAAHSDSRGRQDIWSSLKRKEVYATSGDRILLWFDLMQGELRHPMGSEVSLEQTPVFRVSAAGAFKQKPGCPEYTESSLGADRMQQLCRNECYNPSTERKKIDRIEIVRIMPQQDAGEVIGDLIEDPWRVIPCADTGEGCSVEFSDDGWQDLGRTAAYYARAIQEPSPAINAGGLRCELDDEGNCIKVDPCYGDYRTDADDACLAPNEERAWSSPIFVDPV
ncbi:MAG: DUF3604 domain-containing protein [Pseudomonadales bacterium]